MAIKSPFTELIVLEAAARIELASKWSRRTGNAVTDLSFDVLWSDLRLRCDDSNVVALTRVRVGANALVVVAAVIDEAQFTRELLRVRFGEAVMVQQSEWKSGQLESARQLCASFERYDVVSYWESVTARGDLRIGCETALSVTASDLSKATGFPSELFHVA